MLQVFFILCELCILFFDIFTERFMVAVVFFFNFFAVAYELTWYLHVLH